MDFSGASDSDPVNFIGMYIVYTQPRVADVFSLYIYSQFTDGPDFWNILYFSGVWSPEKRNIWSRKETVPTGCDVLAKYRQDVL